MSDPAPYDDDESSGGTLPGIAKLAATVGWHTAEWSLGLTVKATRRAFEVAAAPTKAIDVVQDVQQTARVLARELLGLADLESRVQNADVARKVAETVPGAEAALRVVESVPGAEVARKVAGTVARPAERWPARDDGASRNGHVPLRAQGEQLLYKARDVHYEEEAHPAYERLVESLAPDEARILRLLLLDGPQPAVDVRTGGPLGLLNSRLLAPGLNMIGARAGCRYVDRVPSYLTNLHRLGLIWFSRETLREPERYQVVEAQPDVLAAVHSVRQARIVRRSIHLTPFGEGFCREALVEERERLRPLPEHASPVKQREPQPPELTA